MIGLKSTGLPLSNNSNWKWVDGSSVTYTNWNKGKNQPDGTAQGVQYAAYLIPAENYQWDDRPADQAVEFLCEIGNHLQALK